MVADTEANILERVIRPEAGDLSAEASRVLLSWRFDDADRERMRLLSEKASEDLLTNDERRELEAYLLVGHLLAIAHSKARQSMQRRQPAA